MIMNIEKTISEHAVSDILTPMLESQDRIVTEDVAPLFEKATGLDTPPASGTVTTTIEESRSVIIAIIRKAWTATLTMLGGASVLSYIAAAYTYLRNRLQGNETYGIPDRRSEISASSPLAANLALLNDRKIGGAIGAPDGCSIPQLLLSPVRSEITEIEDNNEYTALSAGAARFEYWKALFPNLTKLTIGFRGKLTQALFGNCNIEEIVVCAEEVSANVCSSTDRNTTGLKYLRFPYMKRISGGALAQEYTGNRFAQLEDIDCPELESMTGGYTCSCCNGSHAGVKRIYMPKLKTMTGSNTAVLYITNSGCPNLIDIEVGEMTTNLVFVRGSSTIMSNVLADASKTAELNENIRNHIAAKVSDRTGQSALTIYLPQSVRNALETATEDAFASKNWNISPARSN
jgi:hypothetical protein